MIAAATYIRINGYPKNHNAFFKKSCKPNFLKKKSIFNSGM